MVLYEKASKIKFKNYEGKFWIDSWDYVKDKDDLEKWLYDLISEGEDCPTWIWGTNKIKCLNIDIADVIYDACDDGYEGMYDNLEISDLKTDIGSMTGYYEMKRMIDGELFRVNIPKFFLISSFRLN